MSGHQGVDAAGPGGYGPQPIPPLPHHGPTEGPGGWARTRTPAMDGRPPTANHHPREEVNRIRRPSLEDLQRQVEEDGGCEATDGWFVEPDGTCTTASRPGCSPSASANPPTSSPP
jgi:hypothetical protein